SSAPQSGAGRSGWLVFAAPDSTRDPVRSRRPGTSRSEKPAMKLHTTRSASWFSGSVGESGVKFGKMFEIALFPSSPERMKKYRIDAAPALPLNQQIGRAHV